MVIRQVREKFTQPPFWNTRVPVETFPKIRNKLKFDLANPIMSFPGGPVVKKNPPTNAGDARDASSIPGSGRSPGVGNGNPVQYSCLENSMDRGVWWATVHGGHKESDTIEHAYMYAYML